MNVSDFDFELPPERIAQVPAEPRDSARLLAHRIAENETELCTVADLGVHLRSGDLLVMNDTRVLPARLFGNRATGGSVEFLFVEPSTDGRWRAMVKPAKKLKPGELVNVGDGNARVRMVARGLARDGAGSPLWEVALETASGELAIPEQVLEAHGRMPLPPYIEREAEADDLTRYQTVYAAHSGAVAAPTAGLHFTPELLEELDTRGIERATVTLHVGLGTFLPVSVEDVEEHEMHSERYRLEQPAIDKIDACRARGGRVIAVGTTSVRVLEACSSPEGILRSGSGRTDIFIRPGYEFRVVDGLLTNFHLPKSTLLMLVSALAGRQRILDLYERAVRERLRFYSYGDAMLLLP